MKIPKKKNDFGFTLIEMLIVLFVIAILLMLFVPNLSKQREKIDKQGTEALAKVVKTQAELYRLENNQATVSWEGLVTAGYLTQEQVNDAQNRKIGLE